MNILIAGGTGFIGKALVKHLLMQNHSVTVLGRKAKKIKAIFDDQVNTLTWEELDIQGINALQKIECIINLCGVGIGEKRWTDKRRLEIIRSRVEPTKKLAALCAELKENSPALFNANGVGIYGLQTPTDFNLPEPFDESEFINYQNADTFLEYVSHVWEKATFIARDAGVRVVLMRFGMVLDKNGGALSQLVRPFHFYMGGPLGNGKQPVSWISMADLLAAIDFLLTNSQIKGPINLVAPKCVTQKQFAAALGVALKKPAFFPIPGILLTVLLGQMAHELLLNGQHVMPLILMKNNFKFQYPTIQSALNVIYQKQ